MNERTVSWVTWFLRLSASEDKSKEGSDAEDEGQFDDEEPSGVWALGGHGD